MKREFKTLFIVGARPNFMKVAPLIEEIKKYPRNKEVLVHTGQHYDFAMSKVFFQDLKIPKPNYNLGVGSGSYGWQITKIMEKLEPVLFKEKPDLVVVVGDVNSTLAGALTAAKLDIPIAHIEAGLRSFDISMPEEINRKLTDHFSNFLFVTEYQAVKNLINERISKKKIFYVGDIMIDTLVRLRPKIRNLEILKKLKLNPKGYVLLTLHRPENVDDKALFKEVLETIEEIQKRIKIIWPVHPRAKKQLRKYKFLAKTKKMKNLILLEPLGYRETLCLSSKAKFVLTDSGGLQEETTFLRVPCLTLRKTTERPVTCKIGTNVIVDTSTITRQVSKILNGNWKKGKIPKFWDGKTSQRIIKILNSNFRS